MNFEEFKEKFDAFFDEVTTEELVSDFERLGCPVYPKNDYFRFDSDDVIDEESGSGIEYADNPVYNEIRINECSFQVMINRTAYFKGSEELSRADSYFDDNAYIPLAA